MDTRRNLEVEDDLVRGTHGARLRQWLFGREKHLRLECMWKVLEVDTRWDAWWVCGEVWTARVGSVVEQGSTARKVGICFSPKAYHGLHHLALLRWWRFRGISEAVCGESGHMHGGAT